MLNKIQMKKKYRRAVYFTIIMPLAPIGIVLDIATATDQFLCHVFERLKTKMKIYDTDPD